MNKYMNEIIKENGKLRSRVSELEATAAQVQAALEKKIGERIKRQTKEVAWEKMVGREKYEKFLKSSMERKRKKSCIF